MAPPPFALDVPADTGSVPPVLPHRQSSTGTADSTRLPTTTTATATTSNNALSVLHYTDMGLSTELRRILNRSVIDPDFAASSMVRGPSIHTGHHLQSLAERQTAEEHAEQRAAREYLWLQRYHSHVSSSSLRRGNTLPHGSMSYMAPLRQEPGTGHSNSNTPATALGNDMARSSNL